MAWRRKDLKAATERACQRNVMHGSLLRQTPPVLHACHLWVDKARHLFLSWNISLLSRSADGYNVRQTFAPRVSRGVYHGSVCHWQPTWTGSISGCGFATRSVWGQGAGTHYLHCPRMSRSYTHGITGADTWQAHFCRKYQCLPDSQHLQHNEGLAGRQQPNK